MTHKEPPPNEEPQKTEEQKPGDSNAEEPGKPFENNDKPVIDHEHWLSQDKPVEKIEPGKKYPEMYVDPNDEVAKHAKDMKSCERLPPSWTQYPEEIDNFYDKTVLPNIAAVRKDSIADYVP